MRVVLPVALMLLQVLVPLHLSAASVNLTEIISPPTFVTFTLHADPDGWGANQDLGFCDVVLQRFTHAGPETSLLTYQQPTMPGCSDVQSLNWVVARDRLTMWLNAVAINRSDSLGLNAFATDTISSPRLSGNGTDVTSSLDFGLRYAFSEHLSWIVQGLTQGADEGAQTMFLYSPSPDWYMRWIMSGWAFGEGTSSIMQRVVLGYQGHPGPQVSVMLGRQSLGSAELDTTTFALGTSFHDVSVQFNYMIATSTATLEEFSAVQTFHYSTLSLTYPINGSWTVGVTLGDASNFTIGLNAEDGNLSGNISLVPLSFELSYEAKF